MFYLGLDFGTTGARACVLDAEEQVVFEACTGYAASPQQDAADWRVALFDLLAQIPPALRVALESIAMDGTSGTILLADGDLAPVAPALLYNAVLPQANLYEKLLPASLCKGLWLFEQPGAARAQYFFHQADWLAALLTGAGGVTDYHNALKTGYDLHELCWPAWMRALPIASLLPRVVAPGTRLSRISRHTARHFNLNPACNVRAGTTDSIAAFIAARVDRPGDAVTSLGTTLALKLLSTTRVEAAEYGIYSHRFGHLWLAGGASNSGGEVLRQFFSDAQLAELSLRIPPNLSSGLDYYPLPRAGERFPVHDPQLAPRMTPRPGDPARFLHGLLEGIARIEAQGYARLVELGAAPVRRVMTAGGGSSNEVWRRMRENMLGVPVSAAIQKEAAYGVARLAKSGERLMSQ